jgi:sec-independent protein translocase protein TatB
MEIFGVGPLEFILILVLALIILGPEDMVGTARKIGQWVYRVVRSPTWRSILETSQDLRNLPQKIVREAGLEDTLKDIKQTADGVKTDLSQTTRQINTEMQAATTQVNREMQTVVQDANTGMKEAGAETQVAMASAAAGLSDTENTIAPPAAQVDASAQDEAALAPEEEFQLLEDELQPLEEEPQPPEEEPQLTPYEAQLATIATGLGGKGIQPAEPEEDTIFRVTPAVNKVPSTPREAPQADVTPKEPYVAGLEAFAQALGSATTSLQDAEKTTLEGLAPAETESAPPPWAVGIPVGLNLNSAGGMEGLLKNRMDEMMKSIDKLDAKIKSSTGEEETTPPHTDEGAPASAQDAPHGNGTEPAAAPARVRRNAKRPLEAKTPPAAEAADGEVPKAAPRKRAAKTIPPTAQAAEDETPKAAPRKRVAKKTPAAETADQDSTSNQT